MSEKPSFLTNSSIEETINGQALRFYPLSVKAAFELRKVAKPLTSALTMLMRPSEKGKSVVRETPTEMGTVTETTNEPSAEVLVVQEQARQKAISDAIDALTDPSNSLLLGRLIQDSLRDVFPRRMSDADLRKIVEGDDAKDSGMDLPTLKAFLLALAKANEGVFGPLGGRVSAAVGALGNPEESTKSSNSTKAPTG